MLKVVSLGSFGLGVDGDDERVLLLFIDIHGSMGRMQIDCDFRTWYIFSGVPWNRVVIAILHWTVDRYWYTIVSGRYVQNEWPCTRF